MIGYNTLQKSMNGVKVLTDGISFISDGNAQHDNIIYNDYIKSESGQTTISNDTLETINVICSDLTSDDFTTQTITAENIQANYLKIINKLTSAILLEVDGITQNQILSNVVMVLNNLLQIVNADIHQTQTGRIYQQGTNSNYFKDSYINGYLEVGSNIIQSGGSSSLKDLTVDSISMRSDKSIVQSGSNVSNSLGGTTTMKNVIITDSVVLPANIEIPDFTTNDDIIMQDDSVIIQDITNTTTNKNILRNTKTQVLEIDGNITQLNGNGTATLKNTIIQGTAELQGDITQTAGTTVLKTLRCNNITLNDDQLITMSGLGYITQSGTGTNTMKAISLLSNANLTFSGTGIISQALSGVNILSHFRSAGWAIIGGRNNTTFTNYQNIQNNNGLQIQFNRDNSNQYSFLMNNRSSGGNGGFRFQRYIAGVYLDEPLIIDDNITMNKNLSIPGGSLSCSSATIGNISQTELDCLDNCNQNISSKFTSLDSQISSLQNSSTNYSTALTGITYTSGTDTTTIDNNLTISSTKNLLVGTRNIITDLNSNTTNINTLLTRTTDMSYASATDTTLFNNNVKIGYTKKLYIGDMDVEAEINALDTSFTTGTINSTDLTTAVLNVIYSTTTEDLTATGITSLNTTNINGNLYMENALNVYRMDVEPTFTYSKTLGYSNVLVASIVVPTNYNQRIIVNTPISVYRSGSVNNSGSIVIVHFETLSSITAYYTKNDVFVSNLTVSTNNSLPITKQYNNMANTFSYEQYFTNASCDFLPTFDKSNTTTYKVYFTFTYSYSVTLAGTGTTSGYYVNTNVSTTQGTLQFYNSSSGSNYSSTSFNYSPFNVNYISTTNNYSQLQINNLVSNNISNQNTIKTNTLQSSDIQLSNTLTSTTINNSGTTTTNILSSSTINNSGFTETNTFKTYNATVTNNLYAQNYIKSRSLTPGYMFDGTSSFNITPIVCSIKGFRPADNDDYYYINPGFKFEIYANDNYNGTVNVLTNNGDTPTVLAVGVANSVGSIKVFYRNSTSDAFTEITMPFIS